MAITRAQQAKQMLQSGGEVLGPLGEEDNLQSGFVSGTKRLITPGNIGRGLAFILSGGSINPKTVGEFLARQKVMDEISKGVGKKIGPRVQTELMQRQNEMRGTGGYQSDFAKDSDFMSGKATTAEMGSFADGGRIGAQEGGIMPRLNQLGSGVSSAEQMLQEINQRLESAESSLGGGGAMQQPASLASDVFTSAGVTGGPQVSDLRTVTGGGMFDGKQFDSVKSAYDYAVKSAADQRAGGFMGRMVLPGEMGFEGFSGLFNRLNDPNAPQPQLASAPISGIPAAGYADGGNVVGGEFDFEQARQGYKLGKLVKKITKTAKKIVKSPIGKAALLYAGVGGLGNLAAGKGFGSFFSGFTSPSTFLGRVPGIFTKSGLQNIGARIGFGGFENIGGERIFQKNILGKALTSPTGIITATSLAAGLLTPEEEQQAQELADSSTDFDLEKARNSILAAKREQYMMDVRARGFKAEGGPAEDKEPVAKKTMPLLDMGGKEMDLREEGGFVPIGRMEKADDVPARLSKNEFVFTADAVRNAGDGDVDKGAEVMYNMMKNLEAGGEVSEESQGLEGARKMFQTSQRLEEVL